jgi:hypothetical protein
MRLREAVRERGVREGADGSGGADDLDAVREAGERFLTAGDEAIDRALSGDSEAFLRASRQEGGE